MNAFVAPDNVELKELIHAINKLTGSHITTRTCLVVTPDEGMSQTIRDMLTASGLEFHELQDAQPAAQPQPKRKRGPDISIGNGSGQYTVLTGPHAGKKFNYLKLREAIDIGELTEGTRINDRNSGTKVIAAYPKTRKLHLIAAPESKLQEEQPA